MKESVKSTEIYSECVDLVQQITKYHIFLNKEPDLTEMFLNIDKLEDLENKLEKVKDVVAKARSNIESVLVYPEDSE